MEMHGSTSSNNGIPHDEEKGLHKTVTGVTMSPELFEKVLSRSSPICLTRLDDASLQPPSYIPRRKFPVPATTTSGLPIPPHSASLASSSRLSPSLWS